MLAVTRHLCLEVSCPECSETYAIPLETIEESQRLLDHDGPCSGLASFECPASYFAALAPRDAIERLEEAVHAFEDLLHRHGVRAIWESGANAVPADPRRLLAAIAASRRAPRDPTPTVELMRWDDDGGAPGGRHR